MKIPIKKHITIVSNSGKGENIFHCWNSLHSVYVFTQRGIRGINSARADIEKKYGPIYMSVTHSVAKRSIKGYYK